MTSLTSVKFHFLQGQLTNNVQVQFCCDWYNFFVRKGQAAAEFCIPGTIYGQVLSVRAICKVLQPYRLYETISNFKYVILKFQIRPSNCNELGIVSRYHGNE